MRERKGREEKAKEGVSIVGKEGGRGGRKEAYRTDTLRIVVVAVNRENGKRNVDVEVFVVDAGPAVRREGVNTVWTGQSSEEQSGKTHLASLAIPIPASLTNSNPTGRSPKHLSLNAEIVWYKLVLEGRFSWKRSPARRTMSTCEVGEGEFSFLLAMMAEGSFGEGTMRGRPGDSSRGRSSLRSSLPLASLGRQILRIWEKKQILPAVGFGFPRLLDATASRRLVAHTSPPFGGCPIPSASTKWGKEKSQTRSDRVLRSSKFHREEEYAHR